MRRNNYFEQRNLNLSKCNVNKQIHYETLKSCEDQCHQDCHFTYYSYTVSKSEEIKIAQSILRFRHNEMPDLTIRHIAEMPLLTFICNFGGILGMWLGVSFFRIFEIIWIRFRLNILSKMNYNNITNNNNLFVFTNINMNGRKPTQPRIHNS